MKKIIVLCTLGILTIALSCKEEKDTPQMKQVLAIHNEAMDQMKELGNLVGELSSKEDSTALGLRYKEARIELQAAHKSMMEWMQNFGNRFTPDEILNGKELTDQKRLWLDEEEEKVRVLRKQVNSSIEKAKKLLEEEN